MKKIICWAETDIVGSRSETEFEVEEEEWCDMTEEEKESIVRDEISNAGLIETGYSE